MGGDGGDGGASQRAAEDRARKGVARANINRLFGSAEGAFGEEAPTKLQFTSAGGSGGEGGEIVSGGFDQAGYDKAVADYNARAAGAQAEAQTNATARDAIYQDTRNASYDLNKIKLDDNLAESARQLKFTLARSGLFGGSVDVDQRAKQQKIYDQGALDMTNLADSKVADLRSADEKAKLGLLSNIDAGMDAGSSMSAARDSLSTNAAQANAAARGETLNNLFQNAGLIYDAGNIGQGVANARQKYASQFGAFFPNTQGYGGKVVN
jgi:hypothetical protein